MSVDLSKITNSSGVAKSKDSVVGIGPTATGSVAYIYKAPLFLSAGFGTLIISLHLVWFVSSRRSSGEATGVLGFHYCLAAGSRWERFDEC